MKSFLPRTARIFAFAMILVALSSSAPAADSLRYLFLVDHSPEMATRQIATVQIIYDVIRTGFQNEIRPDEKFAIWFYGSRLQTNAPFTWQPGHETEFARAAANLFTGRIYSRIRPREKTLADAAPFIAASPKITVFIITDGGQPLAGTPFDTAINATLDSQHFDMRRADKPFVITLLARNGNWVDGNVFADPNEPFEIPEMDRRNELMEKALAAVRTAPGQATPSTADAGELDKARAALRDALSGKAPAPVAQTATPPAQPKQQPVAQPEVKPTESAQKKDDQPSSPNSPAKVAVAEKSAPVQTPEATATSPQTATPPPPLLARPPEKQTSAQELPKPAVREEPKPVIQHAPPPVQEPPKPAREEAKPVEPKPVVREEPKAVVRDDRKAVIAETKPPVEGKPKQVAQLPVQQPNPTTAPQPAKVTEPVRPVVKEPAPSLAAQKPSTSQRPKPSAPTQTAAIVPEKKFPLPIFVGGLLAIAVGGAIAFRSALRRSRSPGSIITQALPRRDLPKKSK